MKQVVLEIRPALILFSHGSVLCGFRNPVDKHENGLADSGEWAIVRTAFLNYVQPDLITVVRECSAIASHIVVQPFFLTAGAFVLDRVKAAVQEARALFPDCRIVLAAALTDHPAVGEAVMECLALVAKEGDIAREKSCLLRAGCPLYTPGVNGENATCANAGTTRQNLWGPVAREPQAALLVAHGSKLPQADDCMENLGRFVEQQIGLKTRLAYLDCHGPTIGEALAEMHSRGANSFVCVPCFLHEGRHSWLDVPAALSEFHQVYPETYLMLTTALGAMPAIEKALHGRSLEARLF